MDKCSGLKSYATCHIHTPGDTDRYRGNGRVLLVAAQAITHGCGRCSNLLFFELKKY